MLTNHLKIALRNLAKNLRFTALNIVGLSIGLAAGLLILMWVQDEWSFDGYHPAVERIYRENTQLKLSDRMLVLEKCPAPHAAYALREIPEVEKAVRIVDAGTALVGYQDRLNLEKRGVFADTSFFQVFSSEVLAGNPVRPFGDHNTVVLTESFARKYFSGSNTDLASCIGQVVQMDQEPVVVSAIVRDFPGNTQFQFDYIRPYEYLKAHFQPNELWKSREEDWGNCDDATYFRLHPGADIASVERKLGDLTHAHNPLDRGTFYTLQPLALTHLYGPDGKAEGAQTVQIFGLVALFIILIACINYINLATAKASKRAREVGIRKAIGARRSQLVGQFLIESSVVFCLGSALALTLAYVALPYCNQLADKQLQLNWQNPGLMLLMGGVLLGALLVSAVYPALVLSAFQPLQVIKGMFHSPGDHQARLRKGLVVLQFICASALLLAMFVIGQQMQYIQTKNLGYDRDNVFQISLSEQTYENREAMLRELENSAGVTDVTSTSGNILQSRILTGDVDWEGKAPDNLMKISPMAVAPDYLKFFHLPLASGSDFSGTPADAHAFIINETAAAQMGIGDPVGKRFKLWDIEGTVIGVVRDFHFASLHTAIKPAVFYSNPNRHDMICVKTSRQDASRAIASAETLWKRFDAVYPFDYAFMDDTFDKMYRSEQRSGQMFNAFALIALLISCLGLFGLSAFTVEQRTKEIGIRKVMGASVSGITTLLTKDFLMLVAIAFLIASPMAYWGLNRWLANFAYRIDIQWWMFVLAGFSAVGIAFLTVSVQSIKAALANPTASLRNE